MKCGMCIYNKVPLEEGILLFGKAWLALETITLSGLSEVQRQGV